MAPPRPPLLRDPWAWLALLGLVPLVAHSLGAPLGEPFADDFDYLYRALLAPQGGFFDGYGSVLYWRPLGRQVYFGLLAPLIVDHPRLIVALHVLLLAAAVVLLYRALRLRWPGPQAAVAAGFPLLAESTRMLIAWPSHFMDLGALLFAALALHEAAHRRRVTALAALLASLLSKEVGVLAALLLPWMPAGAVSRRDRLRWTAAVAALLLAWGLTYLAVCSRAGLTLPHQFEKNPAVLATPALARYAWAMGNSVRAAFSLSALPERWDGVIWLALGAVAAVAMVLFAASPRARVRGVAALPWVAWGLAWFALATVALIEVYPAWAPYRAVFGAVGLGVALTAMVAAAHPGLLAPLVVVRLAALGLSPGAPREVSIAPQESGAAFDFPRLARLERLVRETRLLLASRFPRLPAGALVVQENLPRLSEYAFAGDRALRVWYRDTTLRWVRLGRIPRDSALQALTVIEYETEGPRPVALVEPAAMGSLLAALDFAEREEWRPALAAVLRADSLQPGTEATGFESVLASTRALAMLGVGDSSVAERGAWQALAVSRFNRQARWILIRLSLGHGRPAEAEAQLDTLVMTDEGDRAARDLRAQLHAARRFRVP